ncbi:hypothetical protein [Frigoribacterium sp. UYMn621]|uniref:hypothetical protein n=1 Tax=Frigoribacterium sp. UYMn621 TaxID=3156343 RepID=UPI003399868B
MAVDILVGTTPIWTTSDYAITEDSPSVDPSDSTGGVGQLSFSTPETRASKTLRSKVVTLQDGAQGTTQGTVTAASGDGVTARLTADSRMGALLVTRTASPFSGTLANAFTYYLGLVGITANIVVDATIASRAVTFPGWGGIAWDYMKQMAASQKVEMALVSNNIVLRPYRGRIAQTYRTATKSWALDATSLAQSVEVYYYQSAPQTNALAYPLGGWQPGVSIYTVKAGETKTYNLSLLPVALTGVGASLTSVQQPVCTAFVASNYSASSVYSVTGADGLPVTPAQWAALGGSLTVAINPDTTSVTITIIGAADPTGKITPYKISMASGTSDDYSSLRLVGTGVFFNKQKVVLQTGLGPDVAPTPIGASVDNRFINTYAEALDLATWTAARYSSARQTLTVTGGGINRRGDTGSYRYATGADFNLLYPGMTAASYNTLWAGQTAAQNTAYWFARVSGDFDNQAFGNIAGSRILDDGQWYRVRSATLTQSGVSLTAERDTIGSDFALTYAAMTAAQFNAIWAGKTFGDFNVAPLNLT